MIDIKQLFEKYTELATKHPLSATLFTASGMVNRYNELHIGFFPLGTGVLNFSPEANLTTLPSCHVFVLGNDFGTIGYTDKLTDRKEKSTNATIRNLISEHGLNLNVETTFFTNFFMGLRDSDKQTGIKDGIQKEFQVFCLEFLKMQLEHTKPKLVLILGKEVLDTLRDLNELPKLNEPPYAPILAGTGVFKGYSVMAIPHPSSAHFNWKKGMREEMRNSIISISFSETP